MLYRVVQRRRNHLSFAGNQQFLDGNDGGDDLLCALEVPILDGDGEVLLGDLLHYIAGNPLLLRTIGINYAFYAEVDGKYRYLPSPASVLPVKSNNTLLLSLVKSPAPPVVSSFDLLDVDLQRSREMLYSTSSSRRQNPSSSYHNSSSSNSFKTAPPPQLQQQQQQSQSYKPSTANENNNSNNNVGFNTIVGEDAAAVIADAAEVAKGAAAAAARSLFSFATTIIDVANTVSSTSATNGGVLSNGTNITVGHSKVQVQRMLSEGGFGTVYLVQDSSGRNYAMKQLICQSKETVAEAHREVDILLALREHQYVIELIDHCSISLPGASSTQSWPRQVMMLFPLYPMGTAWDAIMRCTGGSFDTVTDAHRGPPWPFPEQSILYIGCCIAQALQYMHEKGYSHRDVKPHNILIAEPKNTAEEARGIGKPVLMDFGSVAPVTVQLNSRQDALRLEDEASVKSSMPYRAPELVSPPFPPYLIDERVDTWSLGCTLFCLAFGRSPFETKDGVQRLAILNGKFSMPSGRIYRGCTYSEQFEIMINAMLQVDQKKRPTMADVIDKCQALSSDTYN